MDDDAYLMASFVKLLVADLAAATRFYEGLGFALVHADAVFAHLRWARHADVFLVGTPAGQRVEGRRGLGVLVCFTTSEPDVDTIAARARALGAGVEGPADQPWLTRETIVTDPDGYRLNFVQPR